MLSNYYHQCYNQKNLLLRQNFSHLNQRNQMFLFLTVKNFSSVNQILSFLFNDFPWVNKIQSVKKKTNHMHIRNHLPIAYRLKSIVRSSPNISQKKRKIEINSWNKILYGRRKKNAQNKKKLKNPIKKIKNQDVYMLVVHVHVL
jgi:hypothetical protein